MHSELNGSTLCLFLATQLEVLAPFERQLGLELAHRTFQSQHNLLCGLGLLVEDGLSLTTITRLLAIVTTPSLGIGRVFALLVLCDLVRSVLPAGLAFAVGSASFGDVDHLEGVGTLEFRSE